MSSIKVDLTMLWPSFETDSGDAAISKRKSRTHGVEDKSGTFKWMPLKEPGRFYRRKQADEREREGSQLQETINKLHRSNVSALHLSIQVARSTRPVAVTSST